MPVAIVTGANRGIGLEISRQLAEGGAQVVLTSRDRRSGEEACHGLASQGLSVSHELLDVTDAGSVERMRAAVVERHPSIDILVNNAGVALDGFDAEVAAKTIDVNFHGPRRVFHALLGHLSAGARVVMLSSGLGDRSALGSERREAFATPMTLEELDTQMAAFVDDVRRGEHERQGWPSSAYRVSKIGLNKLTEILAAAHPGLRINAACPGWVRTRMGGAGAPRTPEHGARCPVWLANLGADGPSGGFFRDEAPATW